jgi:hypothetical protein
MFRIVRVPASLDKFFLTLRPRFHWDHFDYFRLLVLVMAFAWGRRHVTNLYRYLEAQHHRTRFNHFCLVQRWDPEAALRQKARELLRALPPQPGETLYLIIDDSKKAKRGKSMDAVAKMKDPPIDAYIRGHQYVCGIVVFRDYVLPYGIQLYVKQVHFAALECPCRKTTELAAQLIRAFTPPAGVKVVVQFDAYYLCRTVVQACREQRFHLASTLKRNRTLCKQGWKLKAGRYGRNLFRRRRTETLVIDKPHGSAHYRYVDARWLQVSHLGVLHVVCSRKGAARKILGLVTDDPELSAAGLIQTYETRWTIEIVQTHMTKRSGFPLRTGGHHVANLDLVVRDDDAINEQFHQLSALGTGQLVQGRLHLPAKRFESLGQDGDVHLRLCLRVQLAQLLRQAVLGLGHLLSCARELVSPDDLGQIDFQQAGLLPFDLGEGVMQGLPSGLQGLGQPCPAVGPCQFMGDERGVGQDPAEILPDQRLQGSGWGKACRAALPLSRPQGVGPTAADVVVVPRRQGTPHTGPLTRATADQAAEHVRMGGVVPAGHVGSAC